MITERKDNSKPKGYFSTVVTIILFINAGITLLLASWLISIMFAGDSEIEWNIRPECDYALYENEDTNLYFLMSTKGDLQPEWISRIAVQGICLDGDFLYIQYPEEEFYRIDLNGFDRERARLQKLPEHIKMLEPEIFLKSVASN